MGRVHRAFVITILFLLNASMTLAASLSSIVAAENLRCENIFSSASNSAFIFQKIANRKLAPREIKTIEALEAKKTFSSTEDNLFVVDESSGGKNTKKLNPKYSARVFKHFDKQIKDKRIAFITGSQGATSELLQVFKLLYPETTADALVEYHANKNQFTELMENISSGKTQHLFISSVRRFDYIPDEITDVVDLRPPSSPERLLPLIENLATRKIEESPLAFRFFFSENTKHHQSTREFLEAASAYLSLKSNDTDDNKGRNQELTTKLRKEIENSKTISHPDKATKIFIISSWVRSAVKKGQYPVPSRRSGSAEESTLNNYIERMKREQPVDWWKRFPEDIQEIWQAYGIAKPVVGKWCACDMALEIDEWVQSREENSNIYPSQRSDVERERQHALFLRRIRKTDRWWQLFSNKTIEAWKKSGHFDSDFEMVDSKELRLKKAGISELELQSAEDWIVNQYKNRPRFNLPYPSSFPKKEKTPDSRYSKNPYEVLQRLSERFPNDWWQMLSESTIQIISQGEQIQTFEFLAANQTRRAKMIEDWVVETERKIAEDFFSLSNKNSKRIPAPADNKASLLEATMHRYIDYVRVKDSNSFEKYFTERTMRIWRAYGSKKALKARTNRTKEESLIELQIQLLKWERHPEQLAQFLMDKESDKDEALAHLMDTIVHLYGENWPENLNPQVRKIWQTAIDLVIKNAIQEVSLWLAEQKRVGKTGMGATVKNFTADDYKIFSHVKRLRSLLGPEWINSLPEESLQFLKTTHFFQRTQSKISTTEDKTNVDEPK